jgi:hypothetical protein
LFYNLAGFFSQPTQTQCITAPVFLLFQCGFLKKTCGKRVSLTLSPRIYIHAAGLFYAQPLNCCKEGRRLNESYLRINRIRTFVNIFTAAAFSLFTAYHTYLVFVTDANRLGRLLGIIPFLFLIAAAVFALIPLPAFRIIRIIFMITGLLLNFAFRLVNAGAVFGRLDFADIPSVLNCAIYVFAQTAKLILLLYYLVFRHNQKLNSKRKTVIALMSVVIVLFVLCFIFECVLILKYGMNIDLSRKYTLISRALYCSGFVSIAVGFMLPVREIEDPDDLMNESQNDEDFMFSVPENTGETADNTGNESLPADYDDDFVI